MNVSNESSLKLPMRTSDLADGKRVRYFHMKDNWQQIRLQLAFFELASGSLCITIPICMGV